MLCELGESLIQCIPINSAMEHGWLTSHEPTREKADDSLPDREVPHTAEGVRSDPSALQWRLTPNGHGPDLIPSRFSLPLTTLTVHENLNRGWLGTLLFPCGCRESRLLALYNGSTSGSAEADGRTNGARRGPRRDSVPKRQFPPGRCRAYNHSCDSTGPGGRERKG